MSDLAIIAGNGGLPAELHRRQPDAALFALEGFGVGLPATPFRLERLVPFLDGLTEQGIRRVCFAGAIQRPRLDPEMFDNRTATLVPRILAAMQSGDDGALREVIAVFEEWGMQIVAASDIAPDLVPGDAVLTGEPSARDQQDAARAKGIVQALGALDIGQGAVVSAGLCIAVETLPGTEAMLAFVAQHTPKGGVLFKAPKPRQDLRIDMPAIGPETITQAQAAGLTGIAFQAGGVLLLERDEVIRRAQTAGISLWGITDAGAEGLSDRG
ncbi:MAG: UDP-2,3-diacylglucosamine diphosphatase LpxI [Paracoccus sp. (in: a-proteobacteria)]|uniref:LpxI family protein n=1 Tax=Paracoccus sp. TaxID=267 RepID=UPI0026DED136|nr:UDP-2,3-diacylglucosamine diphosphatase LpxI [Paracoccus sp. (in: a-proteobacteria)]MDO5620413.1 UDP-2,3-diacylglucosamine diphosphatase LpxI [Paracoccus sp. (in: a-proteobacteria)]